MKCKQSLDEIRAQIKNNNLQRLKGKLVYDHPNNLIHNFRGIFHSNESTENDENSLYLNNQQILLRVLIHFYF